MGVFSNPWKSHNPFNGDAPGARRLSSPRRTPGAGGDPLRFSPPIRGHDDGTGGDAPIHGVQTLSYYLCATPYFPEQGPSPCDGMPGGPVVTDDPECLRYWTPDDMNRCRASGGMPTCFFDYSRGWPPVVTTDCVPQTPITLPEP